MKFNFKKITSVLASAIMLGSTVGIAAAATYPTPFVQGGRADVTIVVTSGTHAGAASDYLAAVDLGQSLQAELAKQTATSTTTSASASGGDSVNLATSSQRLFYNSTIDSAKSTLTRTEMPTLLADGTVTDDSGTSYTYTQSITLGNSQIVYSTSGGDFDDPELIIDAGYSATDPIYNYTLTFNKNINITSTDVQGNDIELLGKKFTIGANSDSDAGTRILYLYGAGDSVTLNEGEEATVTVGGEEHVIKVSGITQVSATDRVSVSVDGSTIREIAEGSSSKVGGLEVYAKTIFYSAKEASQNYATLNIGSDKLKLQDGQTVYEGSDETSIQNTKVTLGSGLSSITLSIAVQDTTADYIKEGESFSDPVLGGMKVSFASVTPGLDADARENFVVTTDNSRNAKVTFTSAISGIEDTFTFLHDQDTSESTVTPILADTANKTIHIVENDTVAINEYMVINSGDYGRIIKLTSIPTGALQSTSTIQFEDALTGENVFSGSGLTVGTNGQGSTNIDGQPYYFHVNNLSAASTVQITWGSSSADAVPGTVTVAPRIKLKSGAWMAILAPVTLTNGTTYSLPGSDTLSTYETGTIASFAKPSQYYGVANGTTTWTNFPFGNVNYTLEYLASNDTVLTTATLVAVNVDKIGSSAAYANVDDCNFNATYGAAILFLEEKKTTESGNSDNGDIVCTSVDTSGTTTPVEVSIGQPQVSGSWSGLQTWTSDSYQSSGVTRYGTYVKYNSLDNDKVEIMYPNEQMFADVLFASEAATITGGSSGTGSVTVLGSITKKDNSLTAADKAKNLIVVGGSCINSVAAEILGGSLCSADFTSTTGVGADQFLVKVVDSPYATNQVAMLVAGYEAADTVKAVTYVTKESPKTDVGTEIKKVTATYADVA